MLSGLSAGRIWLCTQPTDMRCSFDGLSARVRRYLGEDPTSGQWFVFINRRCTMLKILGQAEREVIGEKVSYRLAQQPGSYVVLKYVRQVVKRRDTQAIHTAPAPANVLERSGADVSFLAAMLVDKFCWHLPLYRLC